MDRFAGRSGSESVVSPARTSSPEWLVVNVTQAGRSPERVRDELLVRCREERIEPPSDGDGEPVAAGVPPGKVQASRE